jgi:GTP pyrophosphokinase
MHEIAEYGIAAHWRYKEGGSKPSKQLKWIEELVNIQKEIEDKKDFLDQLEILKIDVFKDRIFVFTPKGDVIELPEGGTPVDFAYAIHTDIGNKCASVKINGTVANLDTPLVSGDIVDIITDKNRKAPNPDWIRFCKTRHARQKIRDSTRHTVKGWITHVMQGREKAKKSLKKSV